MKTQIHLYIMKYNIFLKNTNLKLAQYLGDDIDSPKITFHEINFVLEVEYF